MDKKFYREKIQILSILQEHKTYGICEKKNFKDIWNQNQNM